MTSCVLVKGLGWCLSILAVSAILHADTVRPSSRSRGAEQTPRYRSPSEAEIDALKRQHEAIRRRYLAGQTLVATFSNHRFHPRLLAQNFWYPDPQVTEARIELKEGRATIWFTLPDEPWRHYTRDIVSDETDRNGLRTIVAVQISRERPAIVSTLTLRDYSGVREFRGISLQVSLENPQRDGTVWLSTFEATTGLQPGVSIVSD
jgi:hypothetical protein